MSIQSLPTFIPPNYSKESGIDEMWGDKGPQPHWHNLLARLDSLGPEELSRRQEELQHLLRENGVTYTVYGEDKSSFHPWKLDTIPYIISPEDWGDISTGLKQRAHVLNLLLQDLYGEGKILNSGIVPAELIFSDPAYLLACKQVAGGNLARLTLYAADISKGPDGRIWVIGDRTQAPSGWGYALENRISMTKALPELFQASHINKISDFYDQLTLSLQELAPKMREDPLIAMLTPGPFNETYFEHAYLAALEGFTLVQGQDLMVKDQKVWLKTLGGLDQVDVIIRRVDDTYCDPLELYPESRLGIPGLLESSRQGNIQVANSLGSGILENPGLLAFLPNICQYYLGEPLKLPSLASWWCGHEDERQYTLDNLHKLVIKHIDRRKAHRTHFGWLLDKKAQEALKAEIQAQPFMFVAQEQAVYSTAPAFAQGKLTPRKTVLRCFLVGADTDFQILPGGLARSAPAAGNIYISNQSGGISKDTWVLSPAEASTPTLQIAQRDIADIGLGARPLESLPSRTAENLFWAGRYTVRSIHTARLLQSVVRFQAESKNYEQLRDTEALEVLLKSLTHFTLTYPGFVEKPELLKSPDRELQDILVNTQRIGTLAFTLERWNQSVQSERDRWAASSQIILESVERNMKKYAHEKSFNSRKVRGLLDIVVNGIGGFHGLNADSMAGEDGKILYDLGRYVEQTLLVIHLFRSTLALKREPLVEDSLMKVLLTTTGSLQAYRYRYRSRINLPAVLHMLMLDIQFPRSVAHTLQAILELLQLLPSNSPQNLLPTEQKLALDSLSHIQLCDKEQLLHTEDGSWIREALDELLARISSNITQCSEVIIQKYFSHTEPLRPMVTPLEDESV